MVVVEARICVSAGLDATKEALRDKVECGHGVQSRSVGEWEGFTANGVHASKQASDSLDKKTAPPYFDKCGDIRSWRFAVLTGQSGLE